MNNIFTNSLYHLRQKTEDGWTSHNIRDRNEAIDIALGLQDDVYYCPNRLKQSSHDRLLNARTRGGNQLAEVNDDIEVYTVLVADVDPIRTSGTAATEGQRQAAREVAERIVAYFRDQFGVEPYLIASGNGYYAIAETGLPVSCRPLVKGWLQHLQAMFGNEHAQIDQAFEKPGQILRVPGTYNTKGGERQLCEVLQAGHGKVTEEQLRTLLKSPDAVSDESFEELTQSRTSEWFMEKIAFFRELLEKHWTIQVEREKSVDGQDAHFFEIPCPHKPNASTPGGTYIAVSKARGVYGGCHHDQCSGNRLEDLLKKIVPRFLEHREREFVGSLDGINNPRLIAEKVLESATLARKQEAFFQYRDGIYVVLGRSDIDSIIEQAARNHFVRYALFLRSFGCEAKTIAVTTKMVSDTRLALASIVPTIAGEPPCTLEGEPLTDRLFFKNGHLRIEDALRGRKELEPYSPQLFLTHKLSMDYPLAPPTPSVWLEKLDEWFSDEGSIRLLQQWMGYCLTSGTEEQKIFVMVGAKGRNGKGTVQAVIRQLVGQHNVAAMDIAALPKEFGLDGVLGKSLLVIPEAENMKDVRRAAPLLKSISGGDEVRIARKYEHSLSTVLPVKIILISNELPALTDSSGVVYSRFLTLHFRNSFYGREDTRLHAKLKAELPGIMRWALEGLADLRENGFVRLESGQALRREKLLATNPGNVFREECLVPDPNAAPIPVDEVWVRFVNWCRENDTLLPSRQVFNQQAGLEKRQTGKARRMSYVGVAWRDKKRVQVA